MNTSIPPLTSPIPAKEGSTAITTDWLLAHLPKQDFEPPVISWLDADNLIYTDPYETTTKVRLIRLFNVRTKNQASLSPGFFPKISPDRQWIAFLLGEGEGKQLYLMPQGGSYAKPLTQVAGGLQGFPGFTYDFVWSPNSKQLALYYQPNYLPDYLPPDKNKKIPLRKSIIELYDIPQGFKHQVAEVNGDMRYLSWIANKNFLLFTRERLESLYDRHGVDQAWIELFSLDNEQYYTLAHFQGVQQLLQPVASPQASHVAFLYDADNPIFSFMPSLGVVDITGEVNDHPPAIKRLTNELKLTAPQWSPDGHSIYVLRYYGPYKQLYAVDTKTSKAIQLTFDPIDIQAYAFSPDGQQLAWIGEDAQGTRFIRVAAIDGKEAKTVLTISSVPEQMALGEVREITWPVADYPTPMRGLLFLPLYYSPHKRYPLIVDVHGGGPGASMHLCGSLLAKTPLEWQLWAAKGYAVLVPEFRSSAAFGSLAITRALAQHNELSADLQDILAGVDKLVAESGADSRRIALVGFSAGALRANWATVATKRFCAIVSREGWADNWLLTLKYPIQRVLSIYGSPWCTPGHYWKNSPLFHAIGANTPTLFLMGNPKHGGIDPLHTVYLLYLLLRLQGLKSQYLSYAEEGHVFKIPRNLHDVLERSVAWIDQNC